MDRAGCGFPGKTGGPRLACLYLTVLLMSAFAASLLGAHASWRDLLKTGLQSCLSKALLQTHRSFVKDGS